MQRIPLRPWRVVMQPILLRPRRLTILNIAYTPTRAHGRTHMPTQSDPLPLILQNSGTLFTLANTSVEESVFTYTLAGGLIGADGMLRLTLFCDVLFNNDVADTLTMIISPGGSYAWLTEANMAPAALSATRRKFSVTILLANRNSLASQNLMYRAECDVNFATGRPILVGLIQNVHPTGGPHTFVVSFQWSVASVNNSLRVFQGVLEKV